MAARPSRMPPGSTAIIDPIDRRLLHEPLDFLSAEHDRQRCVLGHLETLANVPAGPAWRPVAREVARYLEDDLPRHVRDEEAHLFPMLRERCRTDADPAALIDTLCKEHRSTEVAAAQISAALADCVKAPRRQLDDKSRGAVRDFVRRQRRHLEREDAVILPFAARHLAEADLRALSEAMTAARRAKTRRRSA